jgi:hypothetical protein
LFNELLPLANRVIDKFDWTFKAYIKGKQSQGPDINGLDMFFQILEVVLRHAEQGLPLHQQLVSVLEQLATRVHGLIVGKICGQS